MRCPMCSKSRLPENGTNSTDGAVCYDDSEECEWPYLTFFLPLSTSILRIEYKASMTWKCLLALPHDGLLASEFFSPVPAMAYDR